MVSSLDKIDLARNEIRVHFSGCERDYPISLYPNRSKCLPLQAPKANRLMSSITSEMPMQTLDLTNQIPQSAKWFLFRSIAKVLVVSHDSHSGSIIAEVRKICPITVRDLVC